MSNEPNWALLPHGAVRFFELPDDWTRRDLKRAYTRLIKRYKPDREPERFQQIRSAYEFLESGARRSGSFRDAAQQMPIVVSPDEPDGQVDMPHDLLADLNRNLGPRIEIYLPPETEEPPEPPGPTWLERLENEGLDELLAECVDEANKTPADYIFLAICADARRKRKRGRPEALRFLAEGLGAHPHSPDLYHAVESYCRSTTHRDDPEGCLEVLAESLPPALFCRFTGPLWRRLAAEKPDRVPFLWSACERLTLRADPDQRARLLLDFLPTAALEVDGRWLKEQRNDVESQALSLYGVDAELDLLQAVINYRAHRTRFLSRGERSGVPDRALQRVLAHGPASPEGLNALLSLIDNHAATIRGLPDNDRGGNQLADAHSVAAVLAAQRLGRGHSFNKRTAPPRRLARWFLLSHGIGNRRDPSTFSSAGLRELAQVIVFSWLTVIVLGMFLIIVGVLQRWLGEGPMLVLSFLALLAGTTLLWARFRRKGLPEIYQLFGTMLAYRVPLRTRFARFLLQWGLSSNELAAGAANELGEVWEADEKFAEKIREDRALAMLHLIDRLRV